MTALRRAHQWIDRVYDEYGAEIQIVTGAFMLAVALLLVVVALQVRDQTQLAQQQCKRSREFGPYIARDYERRNVMPPKQLRGYRATIPTRCG